MGVVRKFAGAATVFAVVAIVATGASAASVGSVPTITGTAVEGSTLEASAADMYRWQACDAGAAACDGAAGRSDPDWADVAGATAGTHLLTSADVGRRLRVLVKETSLGSQWQPSAPTETVSARTLPPDPPPSDPPPEDPPPTEPVPGPDPDPGPEQGPLAQPGPVPSPVAHETANLEPVQGRVLYQPEPGAPFRELTDPTQVPLGAIIDTTKGRVNVISARDEAGNLQSVEFWAGRFSLDQSNGAVPYTEIELIGPRGDRRAGGKVARVWGKGKCKCKSKGNNSSGTVRGTYWLTVDRPNGTFTKVREGVVDVRDFGTGRKVTLTAGESYFAKARD